MQTVIVPQKQIFEQVPTASNVVVNDSAEVRGMTRVRDDALSFVRSDCFVELAQWRRSAV